MTGDDMEDPGITPLTDFEPAIDYAAAEKRALACVESMDRSSVLANIDAKNYADPVMLERDLCWLEAHHRESDRE